MRMMRNLHRIIIFLIVWQASVTGAEQSFNWHSIQSEPFQVHYLHQDVSTAQIVLKNLNHAYSQISKEIGFYIGSPIGVFLCSTDESFEYFAGKPFPEWSTGFAVPNENLIVLRTQGNFIQTAIHELTHILLYGAVAHKSIPRWFNEGLAVYYSNEKEFASSSLISKALITESVIPLSDIEQVISFGSGRAQLAYQQSYLAIIFIMKRYGNDSIKEIVKALAMEESDDAAFLKALGMDLLDFEIEWYRYIREKFRWHFLIELETYLWLFIFLLFVLVFIMIRYRNRKTLQRWEEEEKLTETGDDFF